LNNLSAVHNIMRPSMLETGLEVVSYNLNRKNPHLRLFEYGKTYIKESDTLYHEPEHLSLFVTGNTSIAGWKTKDEPSDLFYLKGVTAQLLKIWNLKNAVWRKADHKKFDAAL